MFSCLKRLHVSSQFTVCIKHTLHLLSDTCAPDMLLYIFPKKWAQQFSTNCHPPVFKCVNQMCKKCFVMAIPAYVCMFISTFCTQIHLPRVWLPKASCDWTMLPIINQKSVGKYEEVMSRKVMCPIMNFRRCVCECPSPEIQTQKIMTPILLT